MTAEDAALEVKISDLADKVNGLESKVSSNIFGYFGNRNSLSIFEWFQKQSIPSIPEGCQDYKVLDNPKRKATYSTPSGQWKCDQTGYSNISPDWKGPGWYRFAINVGSKIPEHTVGGERCNTGGSGWLQGNHPITVGETKTAKVCFNGVYGICNWSATIKIRHCGSYFIYNLPDAPHCNLGYCAE